MCLMAGGLVAESLNDGTDETHCRCDGKICLGVEEYWVYHLL